MSYSALVTRTGRRAALAAMALLFPILLMAQNYVFGPNVRANSDPPGTSAHWTTSSGQHLIAARGDTVYCVWNGNRGGEQHIYFGRSNDGGRTFLPSVRVDNTPSGCEGEGPSLAVDDSGGIHVSWLNHNLTNAAFAYYARSTNGGQSFLPPVRACDSLYRSQYAHLSIAVSRDGRRVYVARSEGNDPPTLPYTDYLSRSTDGGATFITPDTKVNPDTVRTMHEPSVAVFNDTIVMVTWDGGQVFFAMSTNGGGGFGHNMAVSDTGLVTHVNTSLSVDPDGHVCGVWNGLSIVTSSDTGRTFSQARRIPDANGTDPSLCLARDGMTYATWQFWNSEDGMYDEVRFIYSTDHGATFSTPVNPSDGPLNDEENSATVTANQSGAVFVAWTDCRNDSSWVNSDVYVATGLLAAVEEAKPSAEGPLNCEMSPNPTHGPAHVKYWLPGSGRARVEIYDATGRRVRVLENESSSAGLHEILWDGMDARGQKMRPGVYLLRITTPSGAVGCKMELIGE